MIIPKSLYPENLAQLNQMKNSKTNKKTKEKLQEISFLK